MATITRCVKYRQLRIKVLIADTRQEVKRSFNARAKHAVSGWQQSNLTTLGSTIMLPRDASAGLVAHEVFHAVANFFRGMQHRECASTRALAVDNDNEEQVADYLQGLTTRITKLIGAL